MNVGKYNTNPKQYEQLIQEIFKKYPSFTLSPEYAYLVQENLLQLLIRLARYKFVARLIKNTDEILDVGAGSGLGTVFLGQHATKVTGLDTKEYEIKGARAINRRKNVNFKQIDFFEYEPSCKYDVIVAIDVIEHMPENVGYKLVEKSAKHLHNTGMLVLGTPSLYSYEYQSELSKSAHVKLYDQQELVHLVETYYSRTISFSMNDELVHTGFHKMAWYYFVLAFSPKMSD
jgi:2-polyprenyl-3-methyl-5-hydroxy-6-metoxy-1,4-benzoquinol methylase